MSAAWMTTAQVAEQSGRHRDNVIRALRRGVLSGVQACASGPWRVSPTAFEAWMQAGAPIDDPAKARLRRAS